MRTSQVLTSQAAAAEVVALITTITINTMAEVVTITEEAIAMEAEVIATQAQVIAMEVAMAEVMVAEVTAVAAMAAEVTAVADIIDSSTNRQRERKAFLKTDGVFLKLISSLSYLYIKFISTYN